MLTLKVSLIDLRLGRGRNLEAQRIDGLSIWDNHLITNSLSVTKNGFELWIGDSEDPCSSEIQDMRLRSTRDHQDCDGIRVVARANNEQPTVIVARTMGATSPLYISSNGSKLCLSWKFEEVVGFLDRATPNIDMCRKVLKHGAQQTREQIIQGVYALWPGESATFDSNGLAFLECENIHIALPSAFSDRARATDAFVDAIAETLEPLLKKAKRPLLEYSGGQDSTCVAIAASKLRTALESYGVIHPGAIGRQQRVRREELIELLGLIDYTGLSSSTLPIASLFIAECQVTFNDDLYRMCCMDALTSHKLHDVDLVVTGIGGDELFMDDTFWRENWEVPGHASSSTISGTMGRADMFMRRGIWLAHPLAHPRIVNLCRALPAAIRKNRLLNQFVMARAGLSDGYITPRYYETFANVLLLQSMECDFDEFFDESILGDFAICDVRQQLAESCEETRLGIPIKMIGDMYSTIKLEMVLRRYVN